MAEREIKPIWNSSTFLVYTGGLTILGAAAGGLVYLAGQYHGQGTRVAWTLLFLVILYGIAFAFRARDRWIAAGIFAFVSVFIWGTLVLLTIRWIGWHPFKGSFGDWRWSRMLFWVLVLAAAGIDRRYFRFPFIRLISAVIGAIFVVDVLSAGGNWTTWVTLLVGLFYLAVGKVSDKPSTLWLHLVGGALIGSSLIKWFHTSDTDFAVLAFFSLLYVFIAYSTKRSSWAFWATIGFFAATIHYLIGSATGIAENALMGHPPNISAWSYPLAFGLLGFWFVLLGVMGRRHKHPHHAAVAVEKPVVAETPAPPAAEAPPAE